MRSKPSSHHNSKHAVHKRDVPYRAEAAQRKRIKFNFMFVVYLLVLVILFVSFLKTSYASGSGCGDSCDSCGSCGCGGDDESSDDDDDGDNNNEDNDDADNNDGNSADSCSNDATISFSPSNDYLEFTFVISSCSFTTFDLYLVREPTDGRTDKYIYRDRSLSSSQRISGSGKELRTTSYIALCYKPAGGAECCTSSGSVSCS